MNDKNVVVGLDIGTTKVCTIVGVQHDDREVEIIGIGTHPSYGLKKGSVVNIEKTIHSIRNSVEEAVLMSGVTITKATIGVAGSHIYSFNSSGVVAIKGPEITEDDVQRVLETAKAVVIPADREILHVIAQEYTVDTISGIKNPVGMCGVRLEAHVHIVTGTVSLIHNLVKCVEMAGIQAEHVTLQPIASSDAVLSQEEKEMGVMLVDIGGGTTDIAVWKDGSLLHSQIIPVGGNHFTNDLAVALKISHAEAERVKINHGCVLTESINQSSHITVQGIPGTKPREIPLSLVAKVLGARAQEIYSLINGIIEEKSFEEILTGGIVITGGGALLKSMEILGEYILERPTKIGYPIPFGGMTSLMQNPKFSTVMGLLLDSNKRLAREVQKNHIRHTLAGTLEKSELFERQGGHHRRSESLLHSEEPPSVPLDLLTKISQSLKSVFKEIF